MREILVLTATAFEQADLAAYLREPVEQVVAGRSWQRGLSSRGMVRLVETGMGAVNTAHALTCALQAFRPALVLQVGVGGAYLEAGLTIGDVAVASEEIYGDVGVRTREGWQSAEGIGIPLLRREKPYFNHFPLNSELVERARARLAAGGWCQGGPAVRVGPFVTVQECSGTTALGQEREARFRALCENMEGAPAAHLCQLYGVPFLELRSISNQVEDRQVEKWDLPLAAARAQQAGIHLLDTLDL